MSSKKQLLGTLLIVLLPALILWTWWGNTALETNTYTICDEAIPLPFENYRIAQISDLHNTQIGDANSRLIRALIETRPDMIAITGDIIDSRNTDVETALQFVQQAVEIAPCYYVPGNHEARSDQYPVLQEGLSKLGVTILENEKISLEKDGACMILAGIQDPSFPHAADVNTQIQDLIKDSTDYCILLSHHPELFDIYAANEIDLVLSGHSHGGQFRLPLLGGIFAPGQGLFPEYDGGLFTEDNTRMIVSRGIGNSAFPFRFNNRPELVMIKLQTNE